MTGPQVLDYMVAVPDIALGASLAAFVILSILNAADRRDHWARVLFAAVYLGMSMLCAIGLLISYLAS